MYWHSFVAWAAVVGVAAAVGVVPKVVKCGGGCRCWLQTPTLEEYRVICNQTLNTTVSLTEKVFGTRQQTKAYKTYVRVEKASSLVVTAGFLERWREYHSSVLDVWSVDSLRFLEPTTTPSSVHSSPVDWEHVFAGLGLVNVSVDSLPAGLFSGKKGAGLRLSGSSVGYISPGLLRDVKTLKFLEIEDSSIGLFQGPLGGEDLVLFGGSKGKHKVFIRNSTVGRLGEGALRLRAPSREDLVLQDVILGQVAAGAVNLSGRAKLVLDRCQVANLQQLAITLHNETSIAITNSTLIVQPGALSALPCAFYRHHIHSNRVVVLPQVSHQDRSDTQDTGNQTEDQGRPSRVSEMLETVLHPTCVEENLPPWLHQGSTLPPPLPLPMGEHSLLRTGLYSLVAGGGIAIIMVVVLSCLLARARRHRRRRPMNHLENQVVVMSQLPEDPIYEDPTFLQMAPPPPIPPPTFQLSETFAGKQEACSAEAAPETVDCCAVSRPLMKAEENHYIFMR